MTISFFTTEDFLKMQGEGYPRKSIPKKVVLIGVVAPDFDFENDEAIICLDEITKRNNNGDWKTGEVQCNLIKVKQEYFHHEVKITIEITTPGME